MNNNNTIQEISEQDIQNYINGPIQRSINEIAEYLVKNNNRTLHEEYELVQNKKSGLSKRLRDLVIMLVETEKMVEDEKANEEVHTRESAPDKVE